MNKIFISGICMLAVASLSAQTEKLIAEFCIRFIFTLCVANVLNILLRASSATKEKSFAEMENRIWLVLKIKAIYMNEEVRGLEPAALWNYFSDINAVPRPSKK